MRKAVVDHLTILNAAANNGGLLPEEHVGKLEGFELRGGQVIDPALTPAVVEGYDVFGRVVGNLLHLFDRKLTSGQNDSLAGGNVEASALDGYLGTIESFDGAVRHAPLPSGGVDGYHPDAQVGDVIVPTEGNKVVGSDQASTLPVDAATSTPAVDAIAADAKASSIAGAEGADASTSADATKAAASQSAPAADKTGAKAKAVDKA